MPHTLEDRMVLKNLLIHSKDSLHPKMYRQVINELMEASLRLLGIEIEVLLDVIE